MERSEKGWLWKLVQSWWILLTFTLFFNWVAFFYIAYRSKKASWYFWTLVYIIPVILLFTDILGSENWLYNVMMTYLLLGWIGSIIHAFIVRKEFLIRLEARQWAVQEEEDSLKRQVGIEFGVPLRSTPGQVQPQFDSNFAPPPMPGQAKSAPVTKPAVGVFGTSQSGGDAGKTGTAPVWPDAVNLNTATEDTIAALPGIGIILAKKACQHRLANGGFSSVDEFFEILGAKAHVIQRVRPLITVRLAPTPPPPPGGHTVDS